MCDSALVAYVTWCRKDTIHLCILVASATWSKKTQVHVNIWENVNHFALCCEAIQYAHIMTPDLSQNTKKNSRNTYSPDSEKVYDEVSAEFCSQHL